MTIRLLIVFPGHSNRTCICNFFSNFFSTSCCLFNLPVFFLCLLAQFYEIKNSEIPQRKEALRLIVFKKSYKTFISLKFYANPWPLIDSRGCRGKLVRFVEVIDVLTHDLTLSKLFFQVLLDHNSSNILMKLVEAYGFMIIVAIWLTKLLDSWTFI